MPFGANEHCGELSELTRLLAIFHFESLILLNAVKILLTASFASIGLILGSDCCSAYHKSHCVCILSQTSGVLPFSNLDRVTRDICNSFATCVTVIASDNHSLILPLGGSGYAFYSCSESPSDNPDNRPKQHLHLQRLSMPDLSPYFVRRNEHALCQSFALIIH